MPRLIATWNGARGVWETPNLNLLCGHLVPFLETWPTSGTTRSGSLLPRATSEHPTDASVCSSPPGLLPTPRAWDEGGTEAVWEERQQAVMANGHCRSGLPLSMAVQLLPTPQEFDSHFDSLNISDEAAERQLHRTDGIRRRTTGSLTKDLLLLKTPTAQLAVNGGSQHPDKRREGGHGPTLADQVEHLLPTPAARDWKSGQSHVMDRNARPLNEVVEMLLPTPQAADGSRGADVEIGARRPSGAKRSENLTTTVSQLLPTPRASDGPAGTSHSRSWSTTDRNLHTLVHTGELGAPTSPPSAAGKPSSAGQHPGQLSLDELENA